MSNKKKILNKKITIKDIAAHLNVHHSSISRALNPKQKHLVSEELVVKVARSAEELGYVANSFAAALKRGKSSTIGVLIPDLLNPVFPLFLTGIKSVLDNAGYTSMVINTDNCIETEQKALDKMISRQVDGIINLSAFRNDPSLKLCNEKDIPTVMIYRTTRGKGVNSVINNDPSGIQQGIKHLITLGHKNIACIMGPTSISAGYVRIKSFKMEMEDQGLSVNNNLIIIGKSFSIDAGYKAVKKLLSTRNKFTSIITGNDLMAMGAMKAISEAGLTCPEDISVVGFNDIPFLDWFKIPLTTIAVPHFEMGKQAAKILLDNIDDHDTPRRSVVFTPELIVRSSTAPPKNSL